MLVSHRLILIITLSHAVAACDLLPSSPSGCLDKIRSNQAAGPGGSATIQGNIRSQIAENIVPECVTVVVLKTDDYSQPLVEMAYSSFFGDFSIGRLPETTVDILIIHPEYFTEKISSQTLSAGENTIQTRLIPNIGVGEYPPGRMLLSTKAIVDTSEAANIVRYLGTITHVWLHGGPNGRVFSVQLRDGVSMAAAVHRLHWDPRVWSATPRWIRCC